MTRKKQAEWLVLALPFVFSAGVEFLPKWIAIPLGLLVAMKWFNELIVIHDEATKEKKGE